MNPLKSKTAPFILYVLLLPIFVIDCSSYRNIRHDYISFDVHPVQGIDISHHQGNIEWSTVKKSEFTFVYIKATEGAEFIDKNFEHNFTEAQNSGFFVGAYHFFSFKKTGAEQAKNFINNVPKTANTLPPVIDLEYMGHSNIADSKKKLHNELNIYIHEIEKHYKVKPILYTNYVFYNRYLAGSFTEYQIWISDYYKVPQLKNNRQWIFWQYSDRGKVDGIQGYVDFNVFNGDKQQLLNMLSE